MKRLRLVILSFIPVLLFAQGLFESASSDFEDYSTSSSQSQLVDFNGYVRGSVMGGSPQYDISTTFAEIALQTNLKHQEAFLNSDIRLRKGFAFNEDFQHIEIKELYAGYTTNKLDILGGYQLVNWGRTDGFNPTNNVNPNDFFFLSSDPDDQVVSNLMLRLKYRFTPSIDIDIIGVPYYKPSIYRFELFDLNSVIEESFALPISLPITIPFDMPSLDINFSPIEIPERKLTNGTFASRLNFEFPNVGFAVSYFSGYDPYHGVDLDTFKIDYLADPIALEVEYTPKVYKKHTIGADIALPLSGFMVRGEAAVNFIPKKYNGIYVPKNDFSYVLAIEKIWNDYVFLGQLIGKKVFDFEELEELKAPGIGDLDFSNPDLEKLLEIRDYAMEMVEWQSTSFNRLIFNQQKEHNFAIALTASKSFAYDVWNAELTGYYNITSKEYFIRPKLSWKVNDYMQINMGGNYMYAKHFTLFNFSSKVMNGVFAEVKVHF